MPHDQRIVRNENKIEELRETVPNWIKRLERPVAPSITPRFGPLEGIRVVGSGVFVAQPYGATKLAEFGAEVIHVERPGGDTFRFFDPMLTRGPRPHGCDEAEIGKNKLSMGIDLRKSLGIELLMALWKIPDVWMECSAPGTLERAGITNELALAVNSGLVIVRVSTYGQFGKPEYLGRPGYDAMAQAFGGMMNVTGDPSGPPQRAKVFTGDYITALTGWASTIMALWEVKKTGRGQVIDLAQYEAVAQTQGNTMPLYTGQGAVYGHSGNKAPGFQPLPGTPVIGAKLNGRINGPKAAGSFQTGSSDTGRGGPSHAERPFAEFLAGEAGFRQGNAEFGVESGPLCAAGGL